MVAVGWSPDEDKKLAQLWEENTRSVLDMLSEFPGRSRNSLIGRAHRLGLPKKVFPSGPRGPHSPRSLMVRKPRIQPNYNIKKAVRRVLKVEPVPAPPSLVTGDGVLLRALKPHHCRDVIGYRQTGPHTMSAVYCGAPKYGNASFCEYHCSIYFKPPNARRA